MDTHWVSLFLALQRDSKIKSKLPVAAWSPTAGRRRNNYFLRSRKCKRIPAAPKTGGYFFSRCRRNSKRQLHKSKNIEKVQGKQKRMPQKYLLYGVTSQKAVYIWKSFEYNENEDGTFRKEQATHHLRFVPRKLSGLR